MTVNAGWLMLGALGVYAIFYRYYSAFLAARVAALDDSRVTPAHRLNDGQNYHPTNRFVLWGHHFAAIAGAGPLIGPVLAAQFGYLPGLLWLVFGVCIGGAVQDFIILAASVRRDGRSLAEIARQEISPASGLVAMVAILFIVTVALAGLGVVVVNALAESPWGTFTVLASIPIALVMGLYMYRLRRGRVGEASVLGVALLMFAVIAGAWFQEGGPWYEHRHLFLFNADQITIGMGVYGFIASVLPVWLLLCPRDYLSSYMKVGTVALIVGAVLIVRPEIQAPAINANFVDGGGPIVPGALFPFVFITIACGAISGFHALVSSGTTPKMIDREREIRPIGYGAMLMESLVGVAALIAACSLFEADYFKINLKLDAFQKLAEAVPMGHSELAELARLVGEDLEGRASGGVVLAVGITKIFGKFPGAAALMSYFYHFVIMFEALFVLTTIDTGTRIARFLVQEFLGRFYKPMGRQDWWPGTILASLLVCLGWGYFLYTNQIQTIWPMFGVANQLLAIVALAVGTTVIINEGRSRYAWVTLAPMAFIGVTTLTGGFLAVRDIFIPMMDKPGMYSRGLVNSLVTSGMMLCCVLILLDCIPRWRRNWATGRRETRERLGIPEPSSA